MSSFPIPSSATEWSASDTTLAQSVDITPLDSHNLKLLNEVIPKTWINPTPHENYDLIAIGSGAGGLVSSKQTARRGGKSAMISGHLAGGDCLNVGCVPSKALIRAAKLIQEIRGGCGGDNEYGITFNNGTKVSDVNVDFGKVMERMRRLRAKIAPADSHEGTSSAGAHVFQGHGRFLSPTSIEVTSLDGNDVKVLNFKKAVIATGGRATLPIGIKGLNESTPYTTNNTLFNLTKLPREMVVLGAGVVSLEMAQCFAAFGSKVTVVQRSDEILSKEDGDAAKIIRKHLENDGVKFILGAKVEEVVTLSNGDLNVGGGTFPEMKLRVSSKSGEEVTLATQVLLVAMGRSPNVEKLNLDLGGVAFDKGGVSVNDHGQSTSNPNVYAVGDCVSGVPRLTHMAGEMAKMVVNNSLFGDDWKISEMPIPSCMYTEPELASVGIVSEFDESGKRRENVNVWKAGLLHNDRCILEGNNGTGPEDSGFCKIMTEEGSGKILGATIVSSRAGDQINEITLAMKYGIDLKGVGRNVHCYPTEGEAIMGCGIQFINSSWARLD